jgi:DNA-binding NtrC family response regulator
MGKRILVVDADAVSRATLMSGLAAAGYRASCRATAEEALESLAAHPDIELAIVAVNFPELDGFAFLEKVKTLHPSVRVLLMTGLPTYEDMRRAWQNGALAVMDKPVEAGELATKVEGALA